MREGRKILLWGCFSWGMDIIIQVKAQKSWFYMVIGPFNSRAEPSSSSYWGSIRLFSSSGESISCPRWLVGICLSMWCWVCKVSQRLLSLLVAVTVHRAVSYLKCVWRICKSDGLDCSWTFAQSDNKSELRLCGYCLRDWDSILDWIEGEVFLWNPKNAF